MIRSKYFSFLVAITLSVSLSLEITASAADTQDNTHLDGPALEALIDALANHNKKPVMIDVSTGVSAGRNPLFDNDYDWKEDERVQKAAKDLSAQKRRRLVVVLNVTSGR